MTVNFKNNVEQFWKAFANEESNIRALIENREESQKLVSKIETLLTICFHTPYFQLGYNSKIEKFELILTPEGDRMKLPQLFYWYTRAPHHLFEHWRFHYVKPAALIDEEFSLKMYDTFLDEKEIKFYVTPDGERQKFDIQMYSKNLSGLEEDKRYNMLFIFLDNLIGELFTMQNIGYLDFLEEDKPGKGEEVTSHKLKEFMETTMEKENWQAVKNPLKVYTGYTMDPSDGEASTYRDDVFTGYSSLLPLINNYYDEKNDSVLEAKKDGVEYGFLFFDNTEIARDEVVNFRAEIEDRLKEEIESKDIAQLLGGATGFFNSYIDLVVFDWDNFLPIARELFEEFKVRGGYSDFMKNALVIEFDTAQNLS